MEDILKKQQQYKSVGITVFWLAVGLLLMRIITFFLNVFEIFTADTAWGEMLWDAIFTLPMQIGILLIAAYYLYKGQTKTSHREIMEFSSVRKPYWLTILLCIPLSVACYFVSMGVSFIWQIIIIILGYLPSSSSALLPDTFSPLFFIASVFLTAVLPAICEEFTNRGLLLGALSKSFSKWKTVILVGIAFGLFHQHILQTGYTAVFGGVLAYIVLSTGTIWPAVVLHFCNNFISVYLESAEAYGWVLGNFNEMISSFMIESLSGYFFLCLIAAAIVVGLIWVIVKLDKKHRAKIGKTITPVPLYYSPTLRDSAFYIGAIVLASISTIITFIMGV